MSLQNARCNDKEQILVLKCGMRQEGDSWLWASSIAGCNSTSI